MEEIVLKTVENGLSIVIPVYNEKDRFVRTLETIFYNSFNLKETFDNLQLVIVNDGSTNDIKQLINSVKQRFNSIFDIINHKIEICFVSYKNNKGKGYAVKQGFLHCNKTYVWLMDADLSVPLQDFFSGTVELIMTKSDMVIGNRKFKKSVVSNYDSHRKVLSDKYNSIVNKNIFNNTMTEFNDMQCPCKIFKYNLLSTVVNDMSINGFCYDVELIALMKQKNAKISQIPVTFLHDKQGSKVKLFSSSLKMYLDIKKLQKKFNGKI